VESFACWSPGVWLSQLSEAQAVQVRARKLLIERPQLLGLECAGDDSCWWRLRVARRQCSAAHRWGVHHQARQTPVTDFVVNCLDMATVLDANL